MIPGVTKKSEIIKQFINQTTVTLVEMEIEVDFQSANLIIVNHADWKKTNDLLTNAKRTVKEKKKVLEVLEKKYQEYIEQEAKEDEPQKKVSK